MRTATVLMSRIVPVDDGSGGDEAATLGRLGAALRDLQRDTSRVRFDAACDVAVQVLDRHRPRGLLGWQRSRQHGRIAAAALRWWLYATCPSCRGQPRLVPSQPEATCPTCHGSGRRPMDRSVGTDLEAAHWLAAQFDAALRVAGDPPANE